MTARNFLLAAPNASDADLTALMRTSMMAKAGHDRLAWLRETELALDGYGGDANARAATRIVEILRGLEQELRRNASLTAP